MTVLKPGWTFRFTAFTAAFQPPHMSKADFEEIEWVPRCFSEHPNYDVAETLIAEAILEYRNSRPDLRVWKQEVKYGPADSLSKVRKVGHW